MPSQMRLVNELERAHVGCFEDDARAGGETQAARRGLSRRCYFRTCSR